MRKTLACFSENLELVTLSHQIITTKKSTKLSVKCFIDFFPLWLFIYFLLKTLRIIIIIATSRCPSLIGQLSKTDWLLYVLIIGILALGISIPLSLFISEHHNQKGKRIFFKFIEVLTCPISSALLSIILSRCIMEFNVWKMKNRNRNC